MKTSTIEFIAGFICVIIGFFGLFTQLPIKTVLFLALLNIGLVWMLESDSRRFIEKVKCKNE